MSDDKKNETFIASENIEATPAEAPATPLPAQEKGPFVLDMACVFDRAWYEREYPDVAASGIDAATHYRETGHRELRSPNRFFNPNAYRAANPDLAAYEGDLFLHFIFYGVQEGRRIS
ncbi:hypothetical protein [Neokomagataea anthophila]|nr:hypothetical protein [Neokomagataea anthophila]